MKLKSICLPVSIFLYYFASVFLFFCFVSFSCSLNFGHDLFNEILSLSRYTCNQYIDSLQLLIWKKNKNKSQDASQMAGHFCDTRVYSISVRFFLASSHHHLLSQLFFFAFSIQTNKCLHNYSFFDCVSYSRSLSLSLCSCSRIFLFNFTCHT